MARVPGKKVLFPTKVALLLVFPSLVLYLFFNTWPMLFSIGIAFTNATRENILPNPQRISDLENAIACATVLRESPEHRSRAPKLLEDVLAPLNDMLKRFSEIEGLLEAGANPEDIPRAYFFGLYASATKLRRVRPQVASFFNCTELGYATSVELIPGEALEKVDSLITLAGTLTTPQAFTRDQLYEYAKTGRSLAQSLVDYFTKLETGYDEYLSKFVESAQRELDSLQLKFVGLENFARLFRDPRFYNSLYKTLLFVATSVPLKVSAGVLLALLYSSVLIYGRRALRALLLVPWAMPFLLSALTWKFLFLPNGQLGRLFGLNMNVNEWDAFVVYNLFETWLAYPFVMTVTQGALSGVSRDVIEAAYVDGAGLFTRFRRVVLPLIAKPVSVAAILTTGASLQAFLVPLVLNGAGPIGDVCVPLAGCAVGWKNEMLIIFGYNRIMIDREFGYAASMYIVVVAIILIYVVLWFKLMGRPKR